MPDAQRQLRRKLFWMVAVAFALRLAVMAYVYPMQLVPARDHWAFGYETGRIARSIAEGRGFGNPLFANTGPTAWMTPVYPYILAGVFKLFGVFSKASAFVILSCNALISALTCLPIFFFTRKSFGERAGEWAGWIWAIFPYSIYWCVRLVWDTSLVALLLAILFFMALRLAESHHTRDWVVFGLLSGVAALTDPIVLSVLPVLALWALWRLHKERRRWLVPALGAILATLLVVSPWFARNYRVFHKFIPFRDVFPLALRVGNIGDTRHMLTLFAGPWLNPAEWAEFTKYGEITYMQQKWDEESDYLAGHRREYVSNFARRFVYIWTGLWYVPPDLRSEIEPDPAQIILYTGLTILALMGLRRAFHKGVAAPYAIVLVFFPLVYYGTSLEPWYRMPLDPILMALAGYAIASRRPASFARPSAGAPAAAHFPAQNESANRISVDG